MSSIAVRLTTYYPNKEYVSAADALMEGGAQGAASWLTPSGEFARVVDPGTGRRVVLRTLEQYQRGEASYVGVSGDPEVWPWGQRLSIDAWPGVVFRVVDTGRHFNNILPRSTKLIRVTGREPLDIASDYPAAPHARNATATIVEGDNWDGRSVNWEAAAGAAVPFVGDVVDAIDEAAFEVDLTADDILLLGAGSLLAVALLGK